MNIWQDIKKAYKDGGIITRLIFINVSIFLLVQIIDIILMLSSDGLPLSVVDYLAVPASFSELLVRPWSIITYMFLHKDVMHILFNMLMLYWFGQLFNYFLGAHRMLAVYIYGGIAGALMYMIVFNLIPPLTQEVGYSQALGASASIMAIVIAAALFQPEYKVSLLFVGQVKLAYVALFVVGLDVLMLFQSTNTGGHLAHLGGALYGYMFVQAYKNKKDHSVWFNKYFAKLTALFKPKPKIRVTYTRNAPPRNDMEYNQMKKEKQQKLDAILDKISKSGYESLSKEEKDFLFKASKE